MDQKLNTEYVETGECSCIYLICICNKKHLIKKGNKKYTGIYRLFLEYLSLVGVSVWGVRDQVQAPVILGSHSTTKLYP